MTSDVFVIVNAHARRFVESRSLLLDVDRLVEGRATLEVTRTRGELTAAARRARAAGARAVVLCGGDGSYGAGVSAVVDAWGVAAPPLVAFAPGGTVGTIARSLGVAAGGGTLEGIARVVHACVAGRAAHLQTPTLAVETEAGRRLAFIFGSGLVASFFALYDPRAAEDDGPSGGAGRAAAARMVARVFAESFVGGPYARRVLEPLACEVAVDGARVPWPRSSLVVTSVLADLGLGMKVTYRAGQDAARPHVVVSGLPAASLGPRLPRVLRGLPIAAPSEPHFDDLCGELTLDFGGEPGPFVIDGDLRHARRIVVRAGPPVRVVVPTS